MDQLWIEFGSERIPRGLLRGKRANDERCYSLRIEDSPQLAAERFNLKIRMDDRRCVTASGLYYLFLQYTTGEYLSFQ